MCGRYRFSVSDVARLKAEGWIEVDDQWVQVRPTDRPPVVAIVGDANLPERHDMRWGLIPFWSDAERTGYTTFNARAETAAERPAYREPFARRRCLVPATGFYEWRAEDGKKVPHLFRAEEDVFYMAGLWDSWTNRASGEVIRSFTIVTTTPSDIVAPYHDRMPVILPEDAHDDWIDPSVGAEGAQLLLRSAVSPARVQRYESPL